MDTPTPTTSTTPTPPAHETAAAITVAEFARRTACGEILSEDEQAQCATAHRAFLGTDDMSTGDECEDADARVFAETFGPSSRTTSGVTAFAAFIAGIAGTLLALAVHAAG